MLPNLPQTYITFLFFTTVVLCIIATGHIIPESIENGTIVLYLSRSLSRVSIILSNFCGVVLAVGIVQGFFILGCWAVLSLKTDSWNLSFPLSIIPLLVSFLSVFALMTIIGVTFKNLGLSMTLALAHALFLSPLLARLGKIDLASPDFSFSRKVAGIFYYLLPQISDLNQNAIQTMSGSQMSFQPVILALGSACVMLILTGLIFQRMDF